MSDEELVRSIIKMIRTRNKMPAETEPDLTLRSKMDILIETMMLTLGDAITPTEEIEEDADEN